MSLPATKLGCSAVTRTVVGANPFSGISRQRPARCSGMVDYHAVERTVAGLRDSQGAGINTVLGRGDNFITRVLDEQWHSGDELQCIAPAASTRADVRAELHMMAAHHPIAMHRRRSRIDELSQRRCMDQALCYVNSWEDEGLPAGLATQDPAAITWIGVTGWHFEATALAKEALES